MNTQYIHSHWSKAHTHTNSTMGQWANNISLNQTLYKINKDETINNQIMNSRVKIEIRKYKWPMAQNINTSIYLP